MIVTYTLPDAAGTLIYCSERDGPPQFFLTTTEGLPAVPVHVRRTYVIEEKGWTTMRTYSFVELLQGDEVLHSFEMDPFANLAIRRLLPPSTTKTVQV